MTEATITLLTLTSTSVKKRQGETSLLSLINNNRCWVIDTFSIPEFWISECTHIKLNGDCIHLTKSPSKSDRETR